MPNVSTTDIAQDVVSDVVSALSGATIDNGPVFAGVGVFDDVSTFERVADAASGVQCGVVTNQPERGVSSDNADAYVERLELTLAVKFRSPRLAGGAETDAVKQMQRLAEIIRVAMIADRTRGGLAHAIEWNGRLLPGTDVTGSPRIVRKSADAGEYVAVVPVAVGWTIA